MGNAATRPSANPDPGTGTGVPSPAPPRTPPAAPPPPPSTPPVVAASNANTSQNVNVAYPELFSTGIAYPMPARPDFDYPQAGAAGAPSVAGHHVISGIPPANDSPSHANQGGAGGAPGSNDELIRDILVAIGREELADSPVAVDLMKDILAQTDGDTIKAVDLMLEIMAGGDDRPRGRTSSSSFQSPPQPGGSGRGTSSQADGLPVTAGQGLENSSVDALSDQIYQDVLLKAGGDPNRAAFMMRELGLEAPRDPVLEPSAAAAASQGFDNNVSVFPAEAASNQDVVANPPGISSNADQGGNEIFQDLLRQYNGNRDEAMRMMAQLGLEFDATAPPMPQIPQIPSAPESPSLSFLSAPAMSNASSDSRPSLPGEGFPDENPGARHILEPAFPSTLPMGLSTVPERASISTSESSRPPTVAGAGSSAPSLAPLSAVRPPTRSHDGGGQALLRTYQVLAKATDGFASSKLLGAGGFGAVFRGKFRDGTDIAVKKLDTTGLQGEREFQREIKILGRYQSPNVVKLLGYACDEAAYCLVYELMDGSLDTRLEQGSTPLPWQHRIDVAMQAAAGLAFLHRGTSFPLAHMDVKSANVLLRTGAPSNGTNGSSALPPVAKIGDVGLAQLQNTVDGMTMSGTMPRNAQLSGMFRSIRGGPPPAVPHVSGMVSMNMSCVSNANNMASTLRGSNGYLDPVYIDTGRGGSANDVFAFGVVLLELITGRPAIYRPQGNTAGPSVMLANEIGARWVGVAGARPVPPGSPQQEAILQYAKSVADARAGEWPDWALDGLALCAVSCLLPDRTHRVKMDKLLLRLVELHVRAGGAVPQGVMRSCEACGIAGAVQGIAGVRA